MIFCDVNVLVYAFDAESDRHKHYSSWLTARLNGDELLAHNAVVASGFLRIVTNPRIFARPATPEEALAFLAAVRQSPVVVPLREGPRHWEIFERLCRKLGARANLIPDVYLAALAIESGSEFYSADRGFARFPGLRWRHPEDD